MTTIPTLINAGWEFKPCNSCLLNATTGSERDCEGTKADGEFCGYYHSECGELGEWAGIGDGGEIIWCIVCDPDTDAGFKNTTEMMKGHYDHDTKAWVPQSRYIVPTSERD